ncbi:hypothetical protein [Mesobacillus maritimus]|uniref:Uncharacterized protein n=1 Tax=Mesobacillus maritimus TaxID=1643336 RepID=A0ABS7K1D0_9BACI|nr:hypothetical protein [Mesobacillus maritimus]MBY0096008.1 hypothetical protein [Mesobacillus maritimus]
MTSNWRISLCLPIIFNDYPAWSSNRPWNMMKIESVAEAKTLGFKSIVSLFVVFVKSMLCNWKVSLDAVMAMTGMMPLLRTL